MTTATARPSAATPSPSAALAIALRRRLAANLRARAIAAGLTPEVACARAGIPPLQAKRILDGADNATIGDIVALGHVLGCDARDLLAPTESAS